MMSLASHLQSTLQLPATSNLFLGVGSAAVASIVQTRPLRLGEELQARSEGQGKGILWPMGSSHHCLGNCPPADGQG